MKSLAPKVYRLLPKLGAPAGYICVLRDIDRDVYRIDSMDCPQAFIDALLGDISGSYGIELLSILQADDLAASESALYDAHHARLSDEWFTLDAYQLRALRRSELWIFDYSSYYISPKPSENDGAGQSVGAVLDAPSPPGLPYHRYGAPGPRAQESPDSVSWRQSLSDKTDDFMHNHPGLVITIILLVTLLILIHSWGRPYPYPY